MSDRFQRAHQATLGLWGMTPAQPPARIEGPLCGHATSDGDCPRESVAVVDGVPSCVWHRGRA